VTLIATLNNLHTLVVMSPVRMALTRIATHYFFRIVGY